MVRRERKKRGSGRRCRMTSKKGKRKRLLKTSVSTLSAFVLVLHSRDRLETYLGEAPRKSQAPKHGKAALDASLEALEASAPLAGAGALRAAAAAEAVPVGLLLLSGAAAVAAAHTHREAPPEAVAGAASLRTGRERASNTARARARERVCFFKLLSSLSLSLRETRTLLSVEFWSLRRKRSSLLGVSQERGPGLAFPAVPTPAAHSRDIFHTRRKVGKGALGRDRQGDGRKEGNRRRKFELGGIAEKTLSFGDSAGTASPASQTERARRESLFSTQQFSLGIERVGSRKVRSNATKRAASFFFNCLRV